MSPAEHYNPPTMRALWSTEAELPVFSSPAEEIKDYIQSFHKSSLHTYLDAQTTRAIDTMLLGTTATEAEEVLWAPEPPADTDVYYGRRNKIDNLYPNERAWDGKQEVIWTPYEKARELVKSIRFNESDTFYDLGAGYGRLVLYAGITAAAGTCKGIEMVGERAELVQAAIARLKIEKTEYIHSKVQDQDYSDGDVFYMYTPFSAGTFENVFDQLEEISATKPIVIASRGSDIDQAMEYGRFRNLKLVRSAKPGISYYEDKDIAGTPMSKVSGCDDRGTLRTR